MLGLRIRIVSVSAAVIRGINVKNTTLLDFSYQNVLIIKVSNLLVKLRKIRVVLMERRIMLGGRQYG